MSVPLIWVDAFCDRPYGGNPAAVCLLDTPAPAAAHALATAGWLGGVREVRFDTRSGALRATVERGYVEVDLPAETPLRSPIEGSS